MANENQRGQDLNEILRLRREKLEQLLESIRIGDTNSASELTLLAVDNWQKSFHANYHDGEMFGQ